MGTRGSNVTAGKFVAGRNERGGGHASRWKWGENKDVIWWSSSVAKARRGLYICTLPATRLE
jgi:hypothetical protein